ncbi:MAG: PQQ-binding-like beta-propeller repeat protein [Planctomycetota bacterium]
MPPSSSPIPPRALRLWPGVVAVTLEWLAWFVPPLVHPEAGPYGLIASLLAGVAVLVWWAFFSRASGRERVGVLLALVAAVALARLFVHPSIAGAGMGLLYFFQALPVVNLALVIALLASRSRSPGQRRATLVAALCTSCGLFTLVRTGGITGGGSSDFHWRWSPSSEERLIAERAAEAPRAPAAAPSVAQAEWPGFRGPARDGVVRGTRLVSDWSVAPPFELWRRPVGPAWSSFAVSGALVFTQEQRGEEELVTAYRRASGELAWKHAERVRFEESNAGAGPRATPTWHAGTLYTLGATGILNALDATSGALRWTRDAARDTGEKVPEWAFAGSPLVVGELVVVALSGRLAAYARASGELAWLGPAGGASYGSPELATLAGVEQILLLAGGSVLAVSPADGTLLWQHEWKSGASILQPALTAEGELLLAGVDAMGGIGLRRLALARDGASWSVSERWTSRGLRPYFSDYVQHGGAAYGLDNGILACLDLASGERRWKDGRYGHGQVLLLADQALLFVLSEDGELVLVRADPTAFTELARLPVLTGKTWNHPVLVGDTLFVRNAEEMAAFRLATSER